MELAGYINYNNVETLKNASYEEALDYNLGIIEYQNNLKITTGITIAIFSIIYILVRNYCNKNSNRTNNKTYRQRKKACQSAMK